MLCERVSRIAVQPVLTRLRRRDHRMAARPRVLARVPVGRVIATPRGAALLAGAQVHPLRTDLHALLALPALRVPDGRNRGDMCACCVGHAGKLLPAAQMDEGHGDEVTWDTHEDPMAPGRIPFARARCRTWGCLGSRPRAASAARRPRIAARLLRRD